MTEPDYGHLLDGMFVFEGHDIEVASLCLPRAEMEVAFVLGSSLPAGDCNVADVLRATEFVLPAIEIIDSRILEWRISLADTVADNASSARLVLGGNPTRLDTIDVRRVGGTLSRNGSIVETGTSAAVLGNPATAVAWLANKVAAFGVTLDAGHVILPGAFARAVDVEAGTTISCQFDHLGTVEVRFV